MFCYNNKNMYSSFLQTIEYDAECLAELAIYHKRSMKSIEFVLKRVSCVDICHLFISLL